MGGPDPHATASGIYDGKRPVASWMWSFSGLLGVGFLALCGSTTSTDTGWGIPGAVNPVLTLYHHLSGLPPPTPTAVHRRPRMLHLFGLPSFPLNAAKRIPVKSRPTPRVAKKPPLRPYQRPSPHLTDVSSVPVGRPLLTLPLTWFDLPNSLVGGDYVVLPMHLGDVGPLWFMVDTGMTTNLLTPSLCRDLGIVPRDNGVRGIGGDGNLKVLTTTLDAVSIDGRLPVPRFNAAVVDFPQRRIAQKQGFEVVGIVGMQFLEQYDLKYEGDQVEVFRANEGYEAYATHPDWAPVKGILMPARLMACQMTIDDHPKPFLAIIDSGASHSIMNRAAAKALGYDLRDPQLRRGPAVNGFGIIGKESRMPIVPSRVTLSSFVDNITVRNNWLGAWWLTPMEKGSDGVTFPHPAHIAIGDMNLAALTRLTERRLGSYRGPIVLMGQDVLAQRDVLYNGLMKRMLLGPPTGRRTNA